MFRRWIWTLGNLNAILVLGCLALLLTFSQSRAWVLVRYIIFLRKRPVRLPDTVSSDPLEHLSQEKAIVSVLPALKSRLKILCIRHSHAERANSPLHPVSPVISPLFGICALLNIGLFVSMSVAIPYFISEGALGAPLVASAVKSKTCLDAPAMPAGGVPIPGASIRILELDAIFLPCQGRLNEGCEKEL
jgi:hypothetical protein